ncbi:N-acetyltransferase [Alicyclobacillus sp. SO9]|uniref:GNAT family N-acetyltransferase n=1 Tax=Alicyclobacillus sp. SO9 TaxID=2665646 RepID=UPI0018E79A69|nr:GNAT family N-acetyltransferase [Alicyclobacillus sp. SO9]QQE78157.1 GNAT family N-acetyltransferase [Alicyclobacillus sp. SO9]
MTHTLKYREKNDEDDLFVIEIAKAEMDKVLLEAWGRPVDPAEILDVPGAQLSIIEDESNQKIGFYSILRPDDCLYLNTLVIAESSQGQGCGQTVMTHLEDIAQRENRTALELSVQTTNQRAIQFYNKLGFEDVGWSFYRTILMRKIIASS